MIAQHETWLAWEDETAVGLLVLDGSELDWMFVDPGGSVARHWIGRRRRRIAAPYGDDWPSADRDLEVQYHR